MEEPRTSSSKTPLPATEDMSNTATSAVPASSSLHPVALFQPTRVGTVTLSHRVVLAPTTRFRATKTTHVPVIPLVKEFYSQRARIPGTLLITEATYIHPSAGGYYNAPGIRSDDQINAWKELWALGRSADPDVLTNESDDPSNPYQVVSASDLPLSTQLNPKPHPLSIEEIREYTTWYASAAYNVVHRAGFDGVEIHAENGYLVDQFIQDGSNKREDAYGGNVEARNRFALEIVDAIAKVVGAERTAIRLSPWGSVQGRLYYPQSPLTQLNSHLDMGMKDPIPQFSNLVSSLVKYHPSLAYIHVVEPRINGVEDCEHEAHQSNDFLRKIWGDRPIISAGDHTRDIALQVADRRAAEGGTELAPFGRMYTSHPDLPLRLKYNLKLEPYNRSTFYVPGERVDAHVGYTDYIFEDTVEEELKPSDNVDSLQEL
ncbi:hypothetical protein H0H92_013323 [Tricholoma furcatifolium]|nr:hypothetical protein H0H92_013323 [Tricholoma furcatifolium]